MRRLLLVALLLNAGLIAARLWQDRPAEARSGGAATASVENGDVNGNGEIDIADASYLLNWLFLGGPQPVAFAGTGEAGARTIAIAADGSPSENGAALRATLEGIADASAESPYLLELAPGVYDLETDSLVLREHVDIEGSGEFVTTITACGRPDDDSGTVVGANHAELRFLTVESRGFGTEATGRTCPDGTYAIALYNDSANPRLVHVRLVALQELGGPVAFAYGEFNVGAISGARMVHVSIIARGEPNSVNAGIFSREVRVHPLIESSLISARNGVRSSGVYSDSSSLSFSNTQIFGTNEALRNMQREGDGHRVRLEQSLLEASPGGTAIVNDEEFTVELTDCRLAASIEFEGSGSVLHQGTLSEDFEDDAAQARWVAANGARFDVGSNEPTWVEIRRKTVRAPLGPPTQRLIDTSTGAYLSLGGAWTNASDRERKRHIEEIDRREILEKVAALPITSWSYEAEPPEIRHVGPMAQDFRALFGLGADGRHIATLDADGVALAAIQALHAAQRESGRQLEDARRRVERLEQRLAGLEAFGARTTGVVAK